MSTPLKISLPRPHPGQITLLSQAKRFNVIRCGRRWGKTELAVELMVRPALKGQKVGYFTPIYKTLIEVWEKLCLVLEPAIAKKNTTFKIIWLKTGGVIECWSLVKANSPRGRNYHRILVDEAAYVDTLKDTYEKTLEAMLLDFEGDAWFLSSPNGFNDFYELEQNALKYPQDWFAFHASTYGNPFLPKKEIERIRQQTDPDIFAQEYLAEFVTFHGQNFIRYFSRAENVKYVEFNPWLDVFYSFDFNISSSVLIIQRPTEYTTHVISEVDLELTTEQIQGLRKMYPAFCTINGDASGNSRSATNSNTAYDIIVDALGLIWEQVRAMTKNPTHYDSFVFCNYIFRNHTVYIDPSCTGLITDIERVKVLHEKGKFEIDKSNENLTHKLDCLRYHFHAEHWNVVKNVEL